METWFETNLKLIFETCSKLAMKAISKFRSGIFIVNFENISHLFLMFLLLILNK